MSDDFTMLSQAAAAKGVGKGDGPPPAKVARQEAGGPRAYLKFETLAPQMLNAYGEAKYAKMADEDVWKHMSTELKCGAMWMTEYAAIDPERRGTATNRWLQVQIAFCQQQKSASQRQKNAFLMLPDKLACLYDEIDRILPSLEYCLAPKKASPKTGSSALRSGVAVSETSSSAKDPPELDRHAKILYDWLDIKAQGSLLYSYGAGMVCGWRAFFCGIGASPCCAMFPVLR